MKKYDIIGARRKNRTADTLKKLLAVVLLVLLIMPVYGVTAHADMGPKDSLTVYVTNPPKEEYYLDLLAQNLGENVHSNIDEIDALDSDMLSLLYSMEDEGWLPALAHGTGAPMWGQLVGKPDGNKMVHTFGYFGLPDTYRIIIVTKSGDVMVSRAVTRKVLQGSVTFDCKTGKLTVPNVFFAYTVQFLTTFSLTLLIEGLILLLFRYSLKKNWLVFLLVNLVTQIFMTLTVGIMLIKNGSLSANLVLFPVELVILIVEAIAYRFLLKGKSASRNVGYGLVANIASWIGGFFLLNATTLLIINLL